MRFANYLIELFDTNIKVEKISNTFSQWEAEMFIDDKIYNIFFSKFVKNKISQYFNCKELSEVIKERNIKIIYEMWFVDEDGNTNITGEGNAFKVFAGAKKAFDMFTKEINTKYISFSSKEKNRTKLYKKFSKLLTSYKLLGEFTSKDKEIGTIFLLEKK